MEEMLVILAPGEERLIRVRCGEPAGANALPNQEMPEAAVEENIQPPAPRNIAPNIPETPPPMAANRQRRTRKNRKSNGATRKQSGGKRGMNPFMRFASKERKNIMSSNPGMAVTEVGKELGKRWRSLSESEKKKYSS
jgi:structure-specific recognition protein 1